MEYNENFLLKNKRKEIILIISILIMTIWSFALVTNEFFEINYSGTIYDEESNELQMKTDLTLGFFRTSGDVSFSGVFIHVPASGSFEYGMGLIITQILFSILILTLFILLGLFIYLLLTGKNTKMTAIVLSGTLMISLLFIGIGFPLIGSNDSDGYIGVYSEDYGNVTEEEDNEPPDPYLDEAEQQYIEDMFKAGIRFGKSMELLIATIPLTLILIILHPKSKKDEKEKWD